MTEPIMCTGGAGGPAGRWTLRSSRIGPMLTATINSWQDDGKDTVCAYCNKPVPHLEDWFMLVQIAPGMTTINEGWKKYTEERHQRRDHRHHGGDRLMGTYRYGIVDFQP